MQLQILFVFLHSCDPNDTHLGVWVGQDGASVNSLDSKKEGINRPLKLKKPFG